MAIGDAYIDKDALKAYLGISDTDDDTLLTSACLAASQRVEQHCQRQFNKESPAAATARLFEARTGSILDLDDFYSTTGLVIATDDGDVGTFSTTWDTSDFVLVPVNGTEQGVTGFPYRQVRAVNGRAWPCSTGRFRVQVTARWGWDAVPESVKLATKMVAALIFNMKNSPLGVASFTESGLIRVRDVPQAAMLLERYQHPGKTGVLAA